MNFKNNSNHKDLIINIFCILDDLVKTLWNKKIWNNAWRKASLSETEIITIVLFWKLLWYTKMNWIYWHMRNYYFEYFKMPSYKTFVCLSNRYSFEWTSLLSILMNINTKAEKLNLYFIDSSKIAVCWNKRIFRHKVAKWFAERWKSTMWRFYGFKLHIVTDIEWNLLRVKVTSWNIDDREPVIALMKWLSWLLVWDAWYVWEELREKLLEKWIKFLSWVRKNMKKVMTKWQHNLFKLRQIVETWFSVMKGSCNLVSSLARSISWHFARIVYALLAYAIWTQINCLAIS